MTRIRKLLIIGASTLAAGAIGMELRSRYAFPSWLIPLRDEYKSRMSRIKIDDGVDAAEAREIADLYMREYISGCGQPEPPELHDGGWTLALRLGFAGALSDKVVRVDARTGAVGSPGEPSFATFGTFSQDLLGGMAARRRVPPNMALNATGAGAPAR